MADWIAAVLLVLGGGMCLVAGLGIVRMPDVYNRMHAATKAGSLGVGLLAAAVMVAVPELDIIVKAALVAVFMIVTAPIGSHLIGRAAFRTGEPVARGTVIDPETHAFTLPGAEPAETSPESIEFPDGVEETGVPAGDTGRA